MDYSLLYLNWYYQSNFYVLCFVIQSNSKNDFRRKWDKDAYEQLAQKRLNEERDKKDGKMGFKNSFMLRIRCDI